MSNVPGREPNFQEENRQLRADLADTRQKLAEAQADCAAKADALRECQRTFESKCEGQHKWPKEQIAAALASNAGDALVKELERLRACFARDLDSALELAVELGLTDADPRTIFAAAKDLRAQRDQAVLLARVYKEAVYQTDMAHIKSAEHPDSDDLAAAWGDAAVAKRTAEVALAVFLQSLNPPTSDDTLKV